MSTDIFYKFTSFLVPGTIYRCNLTTLPLQPTVFRNAVVAGFDANLFMTQQVCILGPRGREKDWKI